MPARTGGCWVIQIGSQPADWRVYLATKLLEHVIRSSRELDSFETTSRTTMRWLADPDCPGDISPGRNGRSRAG